MKNYLTLGTVAAATLGLTLMVATPAFAHSTPGQFSLGSSTTNSGPNGTSPGSGNNNSGSGNQSGNSNPGPDNSCPTTPSDSLAIDYVGTTSGPPPTVTIKVSGLETSSQPPSNYTVRFFEAPIGTSSTPGTSAAWTPVGPPKAVSSSTQVFTMPYWLAHRQTVRPRRPKVKSGSARTWALALLPWFFMDLATYGLGLLLPVLLKSNGFSSSSGAILGTGLAALFGGLGSLWALFRLDRVGRMRLQIWGFLLGGVGLLLLAALIGSGVRLFLVLISGIMVVNFLYGVGPGLTAGIVPAEIFPTTWRATGQGSATAFSRIGAVVGVFALGYFEGHGGFPAVLVATGVVSFLGVLSTWLFRIEPNQKPLPDMADSA